MRSLGAPDWARGRFEGFSPKHDTDFTITITREGAVSGTAGFAAKQRNDSENVIYFRKR